MLHFVDPSVPSGDEHEALHYLAVQADPSDYLTHQNQLILAEQLI
jgi:hypothetical protein